MRLFSILTIALYIFVIISSVAEVDAQSLTCSECGNSITSGSYVSVDGKVFHPEHFTCAYCGRPIGNTRYYKDKGNYYHPEHYEQFIAPRCAVCGQPIIGQYVEYEGKIYHKDHYEEHIALICDFCGLPINGPYSKTFWSESYHDYHEGRAVKCDYCQRYISDEGTAGGIKYEDGRNICGICLASVINDDNVARHLFEEVKKELRQHGIDIKWDEIGLYLVDRNFLSVMSNENRVIEKQTGFTYHRFETFRETVRNKIFDIYILKGMPEMEFISTAAHELMHVWLYLNAPYDMDKAMSEGSANYASYLVLKKRTLFRAKYLIDNLEKDRDFIYGDGYRRIKRLVGAKRVNGWLDIIAGKEQLPSGY